ncbi:MAG: S24/S26 family peptidase, partial [Verrucomicrobiales bacterium]|nr:S24/S26 family peptidase [Verrucomicrobiales bacterium]
FNSMILAIPIALFVRSFVLDDFVVSTHAVKPEVPQGSYVLVWKLRAPLSPGDLVVFSDPEYPHRTGRVKGANSEGYEIERSGGEEVLLIPAQKITGKVISVLWRASRGE